MAQKILTHNTAKSFLRRYARRVRSSLPASARRIKSQRILKKVLRSPSVKRSRCVAVYLDFGSEVQTQALVRALWKQKKSVLIPDTRRGFNKPVFVHFHPQDKLKRTRFGPLEHAVKQKAVPFVQIGCVLVPGLGFDRSGHRIGYGGGVYDRLLAKAKKARKIGLYFAEQALFSIPRRSHDQRLDEIITDQENIRIS